MPLVTPVFSTNPVILHTLTLPFDFLQPGPQGGKSSHLSPLAAAPSSLPYPKGITPCHPISFRRWWAQGAAPVLTCLDTSNSQFLPHWGERRRTGQCGEVPLARSEAHLTELLDGVCSSMSDYALHVDPNTRRKQYMRFAPRSDRDTGDFPDFNNFQFDGPETSNGLKFACETVVEELEDDIISLFSQDTESVQEELCSRVSDYCRDDSHKNQEF
ncbi:protein canopy-1 isoform X1 [Solea solea]|uniref:protein canopy-1 isoform X1 n=1 Tax=Solea solea TaxID=90069 RepID=UPI00272C3EE2|nr:protein canopy-1 isoform X1 [Solea solea]